MNFALPRRSEVAPMQLDARYRAPLLNYFQKRVGSRVEAEDLTQEVFLRILGYGGPAPLKIADSLIFTVAANLLRDRARRARTRAKDMHISLADDHNLEADKAFSEDCTAERELMSRQALARLLSALDKLGPRTRDVFLLYRLEGMKQREIADRFGISVSAVEKQIVKALSHLSQERARS